MTLAITVEQEQLVDAVSRFAARHAPIDKTRAAFGSIAAGELPSWWPEFVGNGFHAVHLPGHVGGQDGTLADMACVVEAAAAALLPGPLLSTVTASAVASLADCLGQAAADRSGRGRDGGRRAARALRRPRGARRSLVATQRVVRLGVGNLCSATYSAAGPHWRRRRTMVRGRTGPGPDDRIAARHRPVHRRGRRGTRRPRRAGQRGDIRVSPPSGPAASWWPSPRALPPGPCAAALMPQPNTSARVSSSADRSAPFRRCNTKQRRCW